MDNWAAAYVDGEHVTVWELQAEQVLACKDVPVTAFTDYAAKIQGPIIACGLPGPSRIVPCTPFETVGATSISSNIAAVPALAQHNPPAISSGLETVITGYLSVNPVFEGVICVHGAATLWAQISAGEVVSFQTFLTPELITALAGAQHPTDGFCDAVSDTLSHPDRLARQLFVFEVLRHDKFKGFFVAFAQSDDLRGKSGHNIALVVRLTQDHLRVTVIN